MAGNDSSNSNKGLANASKKTREEVSRKGGKATGGKNLTDEMRAEGGRNSGGGQS